MGIVTLTTDFGGRDYFAGSVKGVILATDPDANIIDISHDIASHDVWGAAYMLGMAYRYFPLRTIHVAVVDPGVGGPRRVILAVTDKHYFLAPDNGLLSFVFKDPGFSRVIHVTAEHYFLKMAGSTFHARDVFAPLAGWLSKGVEPEKMGEVIEDYARFSIPAAKAEEDGSCSGEVIYVDKFGNLITNISVADLKVPGPAAAGPYRVRLKERVIDNVSPAYSAVKKGETGAVVNGNGFIEIFVNQGDARKALGSGRGEKVTVSSG